MEQSLILLQSVWIGLAHLDTGKFSHSSLQKGSRCVKLWGHRQWFVPTSTLWFKHMPLISMQFSKQFYVVMVEHWYFHCKDVSQSVTSYNLSGRSWLATSYSHCEEVYIFSQFTTFLLDYRFCSYSTWACPWCPQILPLWIAHYNFGKFWLH